MLQHGYHGHGRRDLTNRAHDGIVRLALLHVTRQRVLLLQRQLIVNSLAHAFFG